MGEEVWLIRKWFKNFGAKKSLGQLNNPNLWVKNFLGFYSDQLCRTKEPITYKLKFEINNKKNRERRPSGAFEMVNLIQPRHSLCWKTYLFFSKSFENNSFSSNRRRDIIEVTELFLLE